MKCRGLRANPSQNALYGVFDNLLVRVASSGVRTALGVLTSRNGYVDFAFGTLQLVIVDGPNGYVLDLATESFQRIVAVGWRGSNRLGYVKGSFLFADPQTGEFYISALEDAASLDPLDFATASSSPDDVVAPLDDHGEAVLLGEVTNETWNYTGAADFPLEHNDGADMDIGCLAAFTAHSLNGSLYWLGRDKNGAVRVYRRNGYQPVPVSNTALNEKLAAAIRAGEDMSKAIAFAQMQGEHGFYWLNVPGLDSTWVYDTKASEWHERTDFVLGSHTRHRAKFHAYCYGRHIVGGETTGDLWELDINANTNAGDPLARDRISPHYADPTGAPTVFGPFELDCKVGSGKPDGSEAVVSLRFSDDGGKTWSAWRNESLGAVGRWQTRQRWLGMGSSRDRVWHVRCIDDAAFAIIRAMVRGR